MLQVSAAAAAAQCLRLVFSLEELQALVVQVESRISCEVQLLQLGRKRLWQRHLGQLVAAQVHALREENTERRVRSLSAAFVIPLTKTQPQKSPADPGFRPHSKWHDEGYPTS